MHQVSKPRAANHSMTEECGRPGTCRSKVGCEAMDEPCTKRIVPRGDDPGALALRHRNSLMPPLLVQCSAPCMARKCTFAPALIGVLLCRIREYPEEGQCRRIYPASTRFPSSCCTMRGCAAICRRYAKR